MQSRTKSRVVGRNVFKTIAAAIVVGGVLVAPNSVQLVDAYFRYDKKQKAKARRVLSELKYRRLIEAKQVNGETHYRLTDKGLAKYHKLVLDELSIPVPKRWDGKWRMVLFDIPIQRRRSRDTFLRYLKDLQFYKLQDSAWIHPFECKEQIGALLHALQLEEHVLYVVVSEANFAGHAAAYFKQAKLLV